MNKVRIVFSLLFFCSLLFSEDNLYTGSAARGSDDAFNVPSGKEGNYGISLIVPAGRSLRVTNLKNNQTVEVLIVEGKGKPGIQLLLNTTAADALGIHPGELSQVTSVELNNKTNPFLSYAADPEGFKEDLEEEFLNKEMNDPDYGSSVNIDEEMEKLGYEKSLPEPEIEEPLVPEDSPPVAPEIDHKTDFEEIIIARTKDDVDDTLVMEEEEAPKKEEPFLSDLVTIPDESDPADKPLDNTLPEPELAEPELAEPELAEPELAVSEESASPEIPLVKPEKAPGSVIYFLTQAEPRPPQIVPELVPENITPEENPNMIAKGEEDSLIIEKPEEESSIPSLEDRTFDDGLTLFTPQYVATEEFNDFIDDFENSGSRFIQVFKFNAANKAVLMKNMEQLYKSFPYLPLTVDNEKGVLLAGPVSRDEVGILLYAVKAYGFNDAIVKRVGK